MNEGNFFIKFLNGKYGLAKTFWLFGVLPCILFNIITPITLILFDLLNNDKITAYIFLSLHFSLTIYLLITYIALWRASNNYSGRKIWSFLTKLFVCTGTLGALINIVFLTTLANSLEFEESKIFSEQNNHKEVGKIASNSIVLDNQISANDEVKINFNNYDECITQSSIENKIMNSDKILDMCNEEFPYIKSEEYFNNDLFEYSWSYDLWKIYINTSNIKDNALLLEAKVNFYYNNCENINHNQPDLSINFKFNNSTNSYAPTLIDNFKINCLSIEKVTLLKRKEY